MAGQCLDWLVQQEKSQICNMQCTIAPLSLWRTEWIFKLLLKLIIASIQGTQATPQPSRHRVYC